MAIGVGTGSTLTFGTSGWSGNIMSIGQSGISRETVQTSHLGSSVWHTFIAADLTDPGGLEVEFQVDLDDFATSASAGKLPPIGKATAAAAETITLTFAGSTSGGVTMSGSGICTNLSFDNPLEELVTGSLTIKFLGSLTFATV